MKHSVVHRCLTAVIGVSIGAAVLAPVAHAQVGPTQAGPSRNGQTATRVADGWTGEGRPGARAEEALTRTVSVQLDRMALKAAIKSIAATANIRLYYKDAMLDAVTSPVSLHVTRVPLSVAFERLLAGTNLRAVSMGGDVVGIQESAAEAAQGTITGKVTSAKTRQPVAGATVTLDDATKGVLTNDDGSFRMTASTGDHTVHVRGLGFVKQSRVVTVRENESVTAEFQLQPSASVLDEVVVTGTVVATERKAIATPITVITADDIQKRGITRVEQLFRGEIPGVVVLDAGTLRYNGQRVNGVEDTLGKMVSSEMYARGSASISSIAMPNPLKTFIDGVELLDPGMLGTIDPQSIERIEVITGPQAATIYGSGAMGGVMQIFTKKGIGDAAPELTLRLKYGMLQNNFNDGVAPAHTHSLNIMGSGGPQFSYSGNLSYNYTGQWQPALFARAYGASVGATHMRGPVTASGSFSLTTNTNGTLGEASGVASSPLDLARRQSGEYGTSNVAAYFVRRLARAASQSAAMNIDYRVTSSWQHHLTVGRTQTKFDLDPQAPIFSTGDDTLFNTSSSTGQRTSLGYNSTVVAPRLGVVTSTFTVGGNGSWADQTSFTACKAYASSTTYVPCRYYSGIDLNDTVNDESWGGFGTLQVGFFDQLYLTAGLRGEHNPYYGSEHTIDWTPTMGVAYTMEYGLVTAKLMTSYGSATRPPLPDMRRQIITSRNGYDPAQYVSQRANPILTPEYSRGPQGGLELYFGNLGSLTINRYDQKVQNLIERIAVDTSPSICLGLPACNPTLEYFNYTYQYMNTASVRQHGWESTGSLNLGPVNLKGTYSWNDSRILSSRIASYYPGRSFVNAPTHSGNFTMGYSRGGTNFTYVLNYMGQRIRSNNDVVYWYLRASSMSRLAMYVDRNRFDFSYIKQPSYVKSDLSASQRLVPWADVTLNITNLGNQYNSDVSPAYPTLGRQTSLGVSLRYPRRR